MINKVELGSVKRNNKPQVQYNVAKNMGQQNFTGLGKVANKLGQWSVKSIQKCEESPMVNVTVLDLSTAIVPRTIFETVIGSKKKDGSNDETDKKPKRKFNFVGGFEALRREGSGLLINCIIPSYIVYGAAKILQRPVMSVFKKSNLAGSWANSDTINQVEAHLKQAAGTTKEERVFNTLKTMFDNIEGVDGDVQNGGMKKFKDIFAGKKEYNDAIRKMTREILSDKPKKGYATDMYRYLVENSGIAENIRFSGDEKFFSSSLSHLCESAGDILHGASKEGLIEQGKNIDFSKYAAKAKKLVNAKSIAGLGIIIPLAIAAQPINRWITHKVAGKKGAPIYNDDKERVLTPEEKKTLTAKKFVAVPLMWATAGLSMLMDRPSLKMFQFKNIFPTMDQARLISAATFSSRLAASEDANELTESTFRDIATFSSFYFLGDYAAKGIATYLEKHNKDGIKLINKLTPRKENANILQKFWHWAKHTKIKSTDELSAIADQATKIKARNLRAICQLGSLAFSLLSLGVFIPIYTRTQSNKKEKMLQEKLAQQKQSFEGSFTQNLIKQNSEVFKPFFS